MVHDPTLSVEAVSEAGPGGGGKAWVRGLRGYEDEVLD